MTKETQIFEYCDVGFATVGDALRHGKEMFELFLTKHHGITIITNKETIKNWNADKQIENNFLAKHVIEEESDGFHIFKFGNSYGWWCLGQS